MQPDRHRTTAYSVYRCMYNIAWKKWNSTINDNDARSKTFRRLWFYLASSPHMVLWKQDDNAGQRESLKFDPRHANTINRPSSKFVEVTSRILLCIILSHSSRIFLFSIFATSNAPRENSAIFHGAFLLRVTYISGTCTCRPN